MTKIIGIAGGTASGKTSILNYLCSELGNKAQVIAMDAYYNPYKEYSFEERLKLNYDHPNAFDIDALVTDLSRLQNGETISMPVYDYVNYTRSDKTIEVIPGPIILIEGLFVLYYPQILPLLDLKVYIQTQTDADIRLIRRILRDQKDRGRSLESILNQYQDTIKPMHEAFITPTKKNADIIIPRGIENKTGVSLLLEHIKMMA